FFSSRRRHTRCYRDWSSDVCSSDLATTKTGSTASYFLRRGAQDSRNDIRHVVPLFRFFSQSALPRCRETIVFRLALVFRLTPFARDPALVFQAIQRRIQRALLNLQAILRNLLDAQEDAVTMQRPEGNGLEDQHVQSALQKVELLVHGSSLS